MLVVYLALGYGERSFEAYCPFGGVESLWGLFTAGEFSCSLGPLNLSMLLALLVLTLGLFYFVLNGILLWLFSAFMPGYHVAGLVPGILGSLVIMIVNWVVHALFGGTK